MSFCIDWTLNSVEVPIATVSKASGLSTEMLRELHRAGHLGSKPDGFVRASHLSLQQFAITLIFADGQKKGISRSDLQPIASSLAASVLLRLQQIEFSKGRLIHRGGTPSLNKQLSALLQNAAVRDFLEVRVPGLGNPTRYAWRDELRLIGCDELPVGDHSEHAFIDTWNVASRMKDVLPGTLFWTSIS